MSKKTNKVECPCCDGMGEVFDRSRVTRSSVSPPYSSCGFCDGSGEVDEDEIDDYDDGMTSKDYKENSKAEAWERRWESDNER